jgi:ureidoacrylate peracid hydrolase
MTVYAIDPRRTALLVIDAQKEYFKEGGPAYLPSARSVLGNIRTLIEAARKARALVVYAQHMNRADGSDAGRMGDFSDPSAAASFVEGSPEVELVDELSPLPGEVVFRKRRYSCFLNTELECVPTAATTACCSCAMRTKGRTSPAPAASRSATPRSSKTP